MRRPKVRPKTPALTYRGRQARTGNSQGFRFEGALFRSHPEFSGEVTAYVVAPGRLLITAEDAPGQTDDPVVEAFLAFLASDIAQAPQQVQPLSETQHARVAMLVDGVEVLPDEDLGDETLL